MIVKSPAALFVLRLLCLANHSLAASLDETFGQGPACRNSAFEAASGGDQFLLPEAQLSLLQRHAGEHVRRHHHADEPTPSLPEVLPLDARSQAARLNAARPFAWMHVPKAGTSFLNFMVHLPGVCPGVPDDLVISNDTLGNDQHFTRVFYETYKWDKPDGACPGSFKGYSSHGGIDDRFEEYPGHGMVMMRQPEQRMLSQHQYFRKDEPGGELDFARSKAGCVVRMMTRGGEECIDGSADSVLDSEVELAVSRLDQFAFVGLTGEWALSMCLGHRIFGGRCRLSDFIDTRVTVVSDGYRPFKSEVLPEIQHDVSVLQGFRDPYDGPVYEAAEKRFRRDGLRYNVSFESCQPCFEEAGVEVQS